MRRLPDNFRKFPPALALAAALVCGCDDGSEKVFKSPGNIESKPNATLLGQLKGGSNVLGGTDAEDAPTVVASVTYLIDVKTETLGLCNGEFAAEIMSNFSLKLPAAEVQCVGLTVDVAALLNGGSSTGVPSSGAGLVDDPLAAISHDGYVLSMSTIGPAKFDPPRPLLLGPVFQNIDKFKGFRRDIATRVFGDAADGAHYDAQGAFHVEVIDNQESYSNAAIKDKPALDKIIHWKMTATGFDGVPPTFGVLIPSLEFKWNTRPIMIPYVQIQGSLKGFLKGDSAMLEKATGVITATLIVKDYSAK